MDCDVCLEPFDDVDRRPKCLPCGHTFCLRCISQQKDKKCPVDRKPYRSVGNNLPDNFKIIEMVQRPGSVCGWCRSCDAEAAEGCLDEHPASLCSLKTARLEDVRPRLAALAQGDAALSKLSDMMTAASSDVHSQVQDCFGQVERQRAELVADKGRQEASLVSDPAAWAMARSRKRPRPTDSAGQVRVKLEPSLHQLDRSSALQRQPSHPLEEHALARGAEQLLADLADPAASCVVTVVRGGAPQGHVLWRGTVRPEEDAASRLLLSRMLCQEALRRELPMLQVKTEGAPAAVLPPAPWVEASNEAEWSPQEMQAVMKVGSRVARGQDWDARWTEDGEPPGPGTVVDVDQGGMYYFVVWDSSPAHKRNRYYMIPPRYYRLKLLPNRPQAPLPKEGPSVLDVSGFVTPLSQKKALPEKMVRNKTVLVGLDCDVAPNWSKALLQRLAPHLEALALVAAQQQHLRQARDMPALRALHLSGRAVAVDPVVDLTDVAEGGAAELAADSVEYAVDKAPLPARLRELHVENASREQLMQVPSLQWLRRLELHCSFDAMLPVMDFATAAPPGGLLWLCLGIYPLRTALALARANAATLKELQLVAATKEPYGCPDLPLELKRCGLASLQRLVLWRATVTGASCGHEVEQCVKQKEALRQALPTASVLCSECDKVPPASPEAQMELANVVVAPRATPEPLRELIAN